jgi:hypothetical protein
MFNVAFEAATKKDAKAELDTRNGELETPMPKAMLAAVKACIDSVGGSGAIGVGIYGTDDQLTLSIARRPE